MNAEFLKNDPNRIIKIIASLSNPREFDFSEIQDADALEIRLDLITEPIEDKIIKLRQNFEGPIVLTLRSSNEGGAFAGGVQEFWDKIEPHLNYVNYVDVEIKFKEIAQILKKQNKLIIASCHKNLMPSKEELRELIDQLQTYGDISKIAVQPQNDEDLLTLLTITSKSSEPLIMSVTGTTYRYARPLLCLFGSLYTYCYIGSETSPGQYSLREMQLLARLLTPGFVDPWFEGRPVRSGDASQFIDRAKDLKLN